MKKQITTALILISLLFTLNSKAQNCGNLSSFDYTTSTSSTPGNTVYNFSFSAHSTSGGEKSINITLDIGSTTVINGGCYISAPASGAAYDYTAGPFDVPTGTVNLTWNGYTNNICGGNTCGGGTALPVELIYLRTTEVELGIKLDWATASEQNNQGFEIERSSDAKNWINIGWVAGSGNSNSIIEYSFLDENSSNGVNYYRLKQIDYDGNFEYTDVNKVVVKSMDRIKLYPNPTKGNVHFSNPVESYKIMDAYGTILNASNETTSAINLSELKNGVYFIETMDDMGIQTINKIFLTR